MDIAACLEQLQNEGDINACSAQLVNGTDLSVLEHCLTHANTLAHQLGIRMAQAAHGDGTRGQLQALHRRLREGDEPRFQLFLYESLSFWNACGLQEKKTTPDGHNAWRQRCLPVMVRMRTATESVVDMPRVATRTRRMNGTVVFR